MKTKEIDGSDVLPGEMYIHAGIGGHVSCKFVISHESKQNSAHYTVTRLDSRNVYDLGFRIGSKNNFNIVDCVSRFIREESK